MKFEPKKTNKVEAAGTFGTILKAGVNTWSKKFKNHIKQ
jgi:hypothetical protein